MMDTLNVANSFSTASNPIGEHGRVDFNHQGSAPFLHAGVEPFSIDSAVSARPTPADIELATTAMATPQLDKDASSAELDEKAAPPNKRYSGPFGWLRWCRDNTYVNLLVYAIACITTSCVYFGWQPYSEMLFRKGAYAWLCPEDWNYALDGACSAQDKAVTSLYSYAQGTEFAGAFVAGLLLDHLGPRYTAILGELIFMGATLLVMFSSERVAGYIPGLFFSGLGVNIVSFPSLTVMERWPSRQALVVSTIVGAQSGASVIAPIMQAIWNRNPQISYEQLWGLFLLCIWLPVTLVYVAVLPTRRGYEHLVKADRQKKAATQQPPLTEGDEEELHLEANFASIVCTEEDTGKVLSTADSSAPGAAGRIEDVRGWAKWKSFFRDVMTWDYGAAAVFMFLLMLQFAYYPSVVRDAISEEVSEFIGWMTPLQAVFSIVIGFIMDYTGTCLVMYGQAATLIIVSLCCALAPHMGGLQRFIGILFIFMQSATYDLKYTFVGETFDPFNFGKLVGVLGIMGGIGVYVNAPITTHTEYRAIFLAWLAASGVMIVMTTFIFMRQLKGYNHKTMEGVEQKHRVGFAKSKKREPAVTEGADEGTSPTRTEHDELV